MKKKLLAITMILLMIMSLMVISPIAAEATVVGTRYVIGGNCFDIRGVLDSGSEISTTYRNNGYTVMLNVNGNTATMDTSGNVSKDGVTLTLSATADGNLTYTVENSTNEQKNVKVSIDADIYMAGNDSAAVYKNGHQSISITQDNTGYSNYGAQVVINFSPEVTTSWIGYYYERFDNRYVDGTRTSYTHADGVDTGLAFSWQMDLAAEETQVIGSSVFAAQEAVRAVAKADGEQFATCLVGGSVTTPYLPDNEVGHTYYWNTSPDGTGTSYNARQTVVVTEEEFNIYSVSVPNTYTINLDNQGATTAGTTTIYEKYDTNYALTEDGDAMSTEANPIEVPVKDDAVFCGYYTSTEADGVQYIDENGYLTGNADTTFFTSAGTLYAKFLPEITDITFEGFEGDYDGEEKGLTVDGDTTGCVVLYSTDGTNFSEEPVTFADAGEYTVYYKVQKDGYADLTGSDTVIIHPKELTLDDVELVPEYESAEFTDEEIKPKAIVRFLDDGVEIDESEYTLEYENNIQVGTATIYAVDNEGGNYILPEGLEANFEITPRPEPLNPKTGDIGIGPWIALTITSTIGLITTSLFATRKRK